MSEQDIRVPIYLVTGFLESGKTKFVCNTVSQPYFQIDETTLVLNTEEGIEEYDNTALLSFHTVSADIEGKEAFTPETLQGFEDTTHPARVLMEYNPLWGMKDVESMKMPEGWGIVQEIALVDAGTYPVYRNNMKSMFVDMFRNADMVIFNRCTKDMPLAEYRRGIKVVNPACEVVFESTDGEMLNIFEAALPYDADADEFEVEDTDFGIFYVDLRDNPERYEGKTVHFRGKIQKSRLMPPKFFGIGWMAMTCCADDLQFIGYIAESPKASKFSNGSWVSVTAKIEIRHMMAYRGKGPVFKVLKMNYINPPETDLVYFN